MTTATERAASWDSKAELAAAGVVAQMASLYERLERADEQHRGLAEQIGTLGADRDEAVKLLREARDEFGYLDCDASDVGETSNGCGECFGCRGDAFLARQGKS